MEYLGNKTRIDHIAIAVKDLDKAIFTYRDLFGFRLTKQREIEGKFTGMKSAELDAGGFSIVLVQGTSPESQVSKYINEYGPGVQHIAVEVNDVSMLSETLKESGIDFSTDLIRGKELIQIFTKRKNNCGMMFEFIQRTDDSSGFEQGNIQDLFNQLEENNAY